MQNCPTGAAAPDRHRIAFRNLRVLRRHVAGRKNVGKKEHLLVAERIVLDFEWAHIGERHAEIFRLAAGKSAEHVRIAEQAGRRLAHRLLRNLRVPVRGITERVEFLLAEETAPAGDGERHHHAVAHLELFVSRAHFHDFAHRLVTEHVAALHRRHVAIIEVEV
jgi:hypothetical protein